MISGPARRFVICVMAAILFPAAAASEPVSLEIGKDRLGADYKGFALDRADPRFCQQACANDAACRAYTYVKPGVKGPRAMCFLKSSVAPATPNDCCTSGAKSNPIDQRANPAPPPRATSMTRTDAAIANPTSLRAYPSMREVPLPPRAAPMRPSPSPQPAPPAQVIPAPYDVTAAPDLQQVEIVWKWGAQGCFPQGAGQPPVPCPYIKDIEGFKVYTVDGAPRGTISDPSRMSILAYLGPDTCFVVTAYKGSLESAKSAPGCTDAPAASNNQATGGIPAPANLHATTSVKDCIAATGGDGPDFCVTVMKANGQFLAWNANSPSSGKVQGYRLYDSANGQALLVAASSAPNARYFLVPATPGVAVTDRCFSVRAYLGGAESASSNAVCLKALPVVGAPALVLKPTSGIVLSGEENHAYFNASCPFPATHFIHREKAKFNGAFPLGYKRENNQDFSETALSSAALCDSLHVDWREGSVMFSLDTLPKDFAKATLRFKSTGFCTNAIHAYHNATHDNTQDAAISYSGDPTAYFTWQKEDPVTGAIQNAPGESSESAVSVTAIVKKSLAAGKKTLGFAFFTDTELHDNDVGCESSFSTFSLEVTPNQ